MGVGGFGGWVSVGGFGGWVGVGGFDGRVGVGGFGGWVGVGGFVGCEKKRDFNGWGYGIRWMGRLERYGEGSR